jgi:hypothetical protein
MSIDIRIKNLSDNQILDCNSKKSNNELCKLLNIELEWENAYKEISINKKEIEKILDKYEASIKKLRDTYDMMIKEKQSNIIIELV